MPQISVIIPIYNAAKYLARCLESIVKQTFKDIEIICINDGSSDNSGKILSEYAKRDDRFIIIDKQNAGVSAARNDGIKRAKGEYIHFMDADDFIDDDYYEKMFSGTNRTSADIVCSGFVTDTKYARNLKYATNFVKYRLRDKLRYSYAFTDGFVWRYLFKRELLVRNDLWFDTNMVSQEDAIFVLKAIYASWAMSFVPDTYYHYMFNEASALHTRDVAHRRKIKEQYQIGKKFKMDFARRHDVYWLWRWRKFLRRIG